MTVQSIIRAFDILKIIAVAHPQGIGVTQIARQVGLHKSTVSRLLATLESVGVVDRAPEGTDFVVGHDLLTLLAPSGFPDNLIALARPHLLALNAATSEDAGLAILEGELALYIDQVSSDPVVQVKDWTGYRFPLHVVSAGKALLAFQPPDFISRYLAKPLEIYTTRTLANPTDLQSALTATQQGGLDWSLGEFDETLNAVAAPILAPNGFALAAITVYGPAFRFPPTHRQEEISQLLLEKCRLLAKQVKKLAPNHTQ
jgi:DNA-binding IclR family transcriptional regulator